VILLYLESFGNPAKFSRIARRISRRKPIVALKSGRSALGARAAASHTGALATRDAFVDALFHQSGVIRTDTVTELFDVASDPEERRNRVRRHPEIAAALQRKLEDYYKAPGRTVAEHALTPEMEETLRSLGYLQ